MCPVGAHQPSFTSLAQHLCLLNPSTFPLLFFLRPPPQGFTTREHLARALLEAICFQTREVLDAMRKDAKLAGLKVLRVDGGASKNDLLMQIQVGCVGAGMRGGGRGTRETDVEADVCHAQGRQARGTESAACGWWRIKE